MSRRERPAKAALSRDAIVKAALEIITSEGDGLTMRRLAAALDTGPASLYVYFRSVEHVHAAILDEMLGQLSLRRTENAWDERLIALLVDYIELLYAHPKIAEKAVFTRPDGLNYLALINEMLELMTEGGVEASRAAWAVDMLLLIATATAAEHGNRNHQGNADSAREQLEETLALGTAALPAIARSMNQLLSGTPEQRMRWVLSSAVAGAATTATPCE